MNKNFLIAIGVLVAVFVFMGVLLSKNSSKVKTSTTSAREIKVEAFEMGFKLSSNTLKRGEKIRVVLSNTGKMPHDFVLDEMPEVKTKIIKNGETDMVEFTVPMTGALTYYCSVGTHRAQGMEGKFTIEE